MAVGNLMGNLLGLVFVGVAGVTGAISLRASAVVLLVFAYGFWLYVVIAHRVVDVIGESVRAHFTADERSLGRRYSIHLRAPGAGEICSAVLNQLRLAAIVWAGLCIWNEQVVLAGILVTPFFVFGGVIVRTDPNLYIGRAVRRGKEVAVAELAALEILRYKLTSHL